MHTALSLASEHIELRSTEQGMLKVLLASTPLAIKGEETLVPMSTLKQCIGIEPTQELVIAAVRDLFRMRHLRADGCFSSFPLVDKAAWSEDAAFLQFRLNETFLDFLRSIADCENVPMF